MPITYEGLRAVWPREAGQENLSMRSLVRRVDADGDDRLDAHPDYQRGRAWTDDQCARFVGFLAEGGVVPPLFVQRWSYVQTDKPDELLDGLQRVTAIRRFLANEVPMEVSDGSRCYLRDLSETDQRLLIGNGGPMLTMKFVRCETRAEVLRMYLRLNRGGTPHTDAEIDRVRAMLASEVSG